MNILLALILVTNLVLLVTVFVSLRRVRKVYESIRTFITPEAEGKPSPLALVTEATAGVLARALVAQAKATFMGKQSGEARAERAVQADIAMDQAAQSPIGQVLTSFPALSKTLRRNPGLIDLAMKFINNKSGPVSTPPAGNNGQGAQAKFKL